MGDKAANGVGVGCQDILGMRRVIVASDGLWRPGIVGS